MKSVYHAKIVPPRLHGTITRERLFNHLDRLADHPITWISSPAGSGKTTLIASYLRARGIPALWYDVDEADADIATFFYYIAEAAKRLKKGRNRPLPLFTPEFRLGIGAFTRHYFESLFRKMSVPGVIVFDNYQDVADDSEFHEVISNGLKLVPDGIRILIASRKESPAPFVTLKADSLLTSLGWHDLRFTLEEVQEMMEMKEGGPLPDEAAQRLYVETQGWVAALVLMMEDEKMPAVTSVGQGSVFDYFSVEVFRKLNERIKGFLLTTALLPEISPELASALTGVEESSAILAHLHRNQYFTERYGNEYRYHPLFREFLLDQAKKTYSKEKISSLRIEAAHLLEQSGKVEEAIKLLLDAKAYTEALPLILGQAQSLLANGRGATLEEWSAKLPEEMQKTTPWLLYWLGLGRLMGDPTESQRLLERAFSIFESQINKTGCLLSVAGIINSIFLESDDYRLFDPWIRWVDENVDPNTPLPVPEMEAQIASAVVFGLTERMFWHPNMERWVERALAASRQVEDSSARLTVKGHVMRYYGSMGQFREMRLLGEELRKTRISPHASPLAHLAYINNTINTHDWVHGSWEETYAHWCKVLHLAEEVGAYLYLGIIYWQGVLIAFEMKNFELAQSLLKKMEQAGILEKKIGRIYYFQLSAYLYLQTGDFFLSSQSADMAVTASTEAGTPIGEAYSRLALAYSLRLLDKREAALEQTILAEKILAPAGTTHILYLVRLTQASLLLDESKTRGGRKVLGEAFQIGREKGYAFSLYSYYQYDEMARLCAEALAADIEVEYARELIRTHHLIPAGGRTEDLSQWPWPCRIRTFGGFELLIDDAPASIHIPKRPIDLLKVLISFGGEEVRQEAIEDELWPEAEGDMARIAFKTNLSRLRKIIGEKTIEVKDGKVSLNPRLVWLDLWALEGLADSVSKLHREHNQKSSPNEAERLMHLAFRIYRGNFLASDDYPWIIPARERLRARFTKTLERLTRILNEAGEREKSTLFYERAMEMGIQPTSEIGKGHK